MTTNLKIHFKYTCDDIRINNNNQYIKDLIVNLVLNIPDCFQFPKSMDLLGHLLLYYLTLTNKVIINM